MLPKRIAELVRVIPEDASYRRRFKQDDWLDSQTTLLADARNDAALGSKFVDAFVEVRKPLPACVHELELLRAYAYRRFRTNDPDVEAAFALEFEPNNPRRILVRCLLLRCEYSFLNIGQRVGLPEGSIRMYHALFWCVRDRGEMFVISLVYPNSRQCEFRPEYAQTESTENLAYRAAVEHGIKAVERLLGMENRLMKKNINEMAEEIARLILDEGLFALQLGFQNQDLPALKNALSVVRMLNSGRGCRKTGTTVRNANGVSDAVAVSASLSNPVAVPNRSCWPSPAPAEHARPEAKNSKTSPVSSEPETTVTRFSIEPNVKLSDLEAAA